MPPPRAQAQRRMHVAACACRVASFPRHWTEKRPRKAGRLADFFFGRGLRPARLVYDRIKFCDHRQLYIRESATSPTETSEAAHFERSNRRSGGPRRSSARSGHRLRRGDTHTLTHTHTHTQTHTHMWGVAHARHEGHVKPPYTKRSVLDSAHDLGQGDVAALVGLALANNRD